MQTLYPNNPAARIWRGLVQMPDISGRATVIDFFFGLMVLHMLGLAIDAMFADPARSIGSYHSWGSAIFGFLSFSVVIRRLHDQDRSGWFSLIILPNVLIKTLAQYRYEIGLQPSPTPELPYYAVFVIVSVLFFGMMLLPGTEGPNGFGPDPRQVQKKEA